MSASSSWRWAWRWPSAPTASMQPRLPWRWRRPSCMCSTIPGSSRCSSSAPAPCCTPRDGAISTGWAASSIACRAPPPSSWWARSPISALPPLNGFVSEWLLFQAVFAAPALAAGGRCASRRRRSAPCWRLAAALAAACFVRVYGIGVSRPAAQRRGCARRMKCRWPQQIAMGGLAGLCMLGGLLGSVLAMALAPVLGDLVGGGLPQAGSGPTPFSLVAFDPARSIYDAPVIALFVAIASLTTLVVVHRLSAPAHAARPGLGLRLPRSVAGHAIHRVELLPAVAPGLRRRGLCARAKRSSCRRPATAGRRASRCVLRRLCVASALRRARPGRSQPVRAAEHAAVPHHPALPRADVRRPDHPARSSRR